MIFLSSAFNENQTLYAGLGSVLGRSSEENIGNLDGNR